ncbi:MAG: 2-C-methyl-D-erythritol 4-phosphate cytidylyltransferase [Colwelliaceae bacterium]|nr:2-C-methyl-D-erythritol 4-phosphate cytidylyltransferase [Colwelliaceae bacterium]
MNNTIAVTAVVPAAGAGKRMKSNQPKQYLSLAGKTVLEQTVAKLLASQHVNRVVIALSEGDEYFPSTELANDKRITTVLGGKERVDSVLAGVNTCEPSEWVMVHDAARPCVRTSEIDTLVSQCIEAQQGGLLAAPVKDTMKRGTKSGDVSETVERELLWHALTPQMYRAGELVEAISQGLESGVAITDESSAMEAAGFPSMLVSASSDNLKITQPEDLAIAEFILTQQLRSDAHATQQTIIKQTSTQEQE